MKQINLLMLVAAILLALVSGCGVGAVGLLEKAAGKDDSRPVTLESFFTGHKGTFVLRDLSNHSTMIVNEEQANKPLPPESTFTICNALIALQTGVAKDGNAMRRWNGTTYPIEAWNRDHTLATAMANSVDWYDQEMARDIGEERMTALLGKIGYGNGDVSGGLDRFWLDSTLKISALEQVDFLARLYQEKLPLNRRSMQIVKGLMTLQEEPELLYAGKTGEGKEVGWFVGYVTSKGKTYVFAANIEGEKEGNGAQARAIAEDILREMRLLPAKETSFR
ncbi:class D beta-lactamase [Brevibacillus sp. SYP-B805]|uniref:penicillin-binding transpeptidase domain-containing protein n=1 Tax=Brevibacillus sp. SYP-B805 TaxID=1578199 RepID=UPI0013EB1E07|nr:penicillin-binding transpeptidase domain-containing protein [Brevibacillus sp. SYP-B805]NGQ93633.1 class D beta-lactamase [Brevibacillus sp. SYP-B805]